MNCEPQSWESWGASALSLGEAVGEALPDGVVQRAEAQGGVGAGGVAAADQVAVVAVDHRHQPQPPFAGGDLGQVGRPHLIGALGLDPALMLGARDPPLRDQQPVLAHDPPDALAVDDPARRPGPAQAAAQHRGHAPGAEPGPVAADVEDVCL